MSTTFILFDKYRTYLFVAQRLLKNLVSNLPSPTRQKTVQKGTKKRNSHSLFLRAHDSDQVLRYDLSPFTTPQADFSLLLLKEQLPGHPRAMSPKASQVDSINGTNQFRLHSAPEAGTYLLPFARSKTKFFIVDRRAELSSATLPNIFRPSPYQQFRQSLTVVHSPAKARDSNRSRSCPQPCRRILDDFGAQDLKGWWE